MKKKTKKILLLLGGTGALVAIAILAYVWFMPHRDVQSAEADAKMTVTQLSNEYVLDHTAANHKYLDEEGESNVIVIEGAVQSVGQDQKGRKVVVLRAAEAKILVSCTFLETANKRAATLVEGALVKIKGEIEGGGEYDADFEEYSDIVFGNCDVVD